MRVDRLKLEHFRNYQRADIEFDSGVNVIVGENAQGKTNLLEAVEYLAGCRSHRARSDKELISFDSDFSRVEGMLFSRERGFHVEITMKRGARRSILANGVKFKTAGELGELLNTVLFCPEDLLLIREGAAARRRFLDDSICQLRPRYAAALTEYNRLHEHKTRILRDWKEKPDLLGPLDDFSVRMCQTGAMLIHYRAHYINKLTQQAPLIHRDFSGGREELALRYQTVSSVTDPLGSVQDIYCQLLDHWQSHRSAELEARSCLSGPHKDDLLVDINGISAKTYGSQGQTRTAALSLKLAEREIAYLDRGEYPVLLLDDVLSELDTRRQEFVLSRIKGGQVFITCCEEDRLSAMTGGKVFRVENGNVSSEPCQ